MSLYQRAAEYRQEREIRLRERKKLLDWQAAYILEKYGYWDPEFCTIFSAIAGLRRKPTSILGELLAA